MRTTTTIPSRSTFAGCARPATSATTSRSERPAHDRRGVLGRRGAGRLRGFRCFLVVAGMNRHAVIVHVLWWLVFACAWLAMWADGKHSARLSKEDRL